MCDGKTHVRKLNTSLGILRNMMSEESKRLVPNVYAVSWVDPTHPSTAGHFCRHPYEKYIMP